MKYTVGLIAAVAAIGSNAQSFADLPDCGVCHDIIHYTQYHVTN